MPGNCPICSEKVKGKVRAQGSSQEVRIRVFFLKFQIIYSHINRTSYENPHPLTFSLEVFRQLKVYGIKWDQVVPEISNIISTIEGQRRFRIAGKN